MTFIVVNLCGFNLEPSLRIKWNEMNVNEKIVNEKDNIKCQLRESPSSLSFGLFLWSCFFSLRHFQSEHRHREFRTLGRVSVSNLVRNWLQSCRGVASFSFLQSTCVCQSVAVYRNFDVLQVFRPLLRNLRSFLVRVFLKTVCTLVLHRSLVLVKFLNPP